MLTRTRLAGCTALLLLFAAVPVTPGVCTDGAPLPLLPPSDAATAPVFRLGTAGRPFAWSTVVGDFNADGRPDVIVADRASSWSRNTGYRLDFAISGEVVISDSIQTADDGVGIRVADVDDDSDLDIVLASTISGRTIGVWLNDGAGHFTRSAMRVATLVLLRPDAVSLDSSDGSTLTFDVPSRRGAAMAPVQARAPAPATSAWRLAVLDSASVSFLTTSSAAPRAPPVLL